MNARNLYRMSVGVGEQSALAVLYTVLPFELERNHAVSLKVKSFRHTHNDAQNMAHRRESRLNKDASLADRDAFDFVFIQQILKSRH